MSEEPGLSFDSAAEEYDRVRPGYPASLVDIACARGGLVPGSKVVEVGCGTGKLTVALAERALRVEAVDPGGALLELARRKTEGSSVRFHEARFEDIELPEGTFDAVFSATAFHWVDPDVGWSKAARLLRPGGLLALLLHTGGGATPELRAAFLEAWRQVLPEAAGWSFRGADTIWKGAEERRGNVSELWAWLEKRDLARPEAATSFVDVELVKVAEEQEVTAAEHLAHVRTTSSYLGLTPDERKALEDGLSAVFDSVGGSYRGTRFATLVTARSA